MPYINEEPRIAAGLFLFLCRPQIYGEAGGVSFGVSAGGVAGAAGSVAGGVVAGVSVAGGAWSVSLAAS